MCCLLKALLFSYSRLKLKVCATTGCIEKTEICVVLHVFSTRNFFSEITLLWLIVCRKSIARIHEAWKCFQDPESEKKLRKLKRKSKILGFLTQNHRSGCNFMRAIDCAHSRSLRMLLWPWFREMSVFYWSENMKILHFDASECTESISRLK